MARATATATRDDGNTASRCTICLSAEGAVLQRGCCCRGDSGWVHLECITQLAAHKDDHDEDWSGWAACGTCNGDFTGCVQHGLARAWWSRVESLDNGHEDRLAAADNLAVSCGDQGKHAEAEALQREVLAVQKRVLGDEHPDTLDTACNLAISCSDQGKYAEAEALQREVLAVQKRVLGDEHPDTLDTAGNLAASCSEQGKYAEAEALQREVLAVQKRVLGDEHPDTLSTAGNLASSCS